MSPSAAAPTANPRKTMTIRRLGRVEIDALSAAVAMIPDAVWAAENAAKPNRFEVLDTTQHIVFRFIDGPRDWRRSHDRDAWASWRPRLEPVLHEAVAPYGYAHGVFPHKIHVPLFTNPHVVSFFGGEERHLAKGEAVEVNNLAPHWVRNGGDAARIHLIFEYYDADQPDPDWLAPFLSASGAS